MTKEQIQKIAANLEARCKALANSHSNESNEKYSVSHPQMKQLYSDMAKLADLIWHSLEIEKEL